jgi:CBS domain-containing protein
VFRSPVVKVMKYPVIASVSESVSSVVEKMISNNIGAIIIMSQGVKVGIITEKDVVKKIIIEEKDPRKTYAEEIMSTPIISIEENQSIAIAIRVMKKRGVRRLAVTSKGRLVGIVTERRLLDALATLA